MVLKSVWFTLFIISACYLFDPLIPEVVNNVYTYKDNKKIYFQSSFKIVGEIPSDFDNYIIKYFTACTPENETKDLLTVRISNWYKYYETFRTFQYDGDYLMVNDVIVSGLCVFGRDKYMISLKGQDVAPVRYPFIVKEEYEDVIVLSHFRLVFGSMFYNILFAMISIPQDVKNRSIIVVECYSEGILNIFKEIYGQLYGPNKVVNIAPNEFIYAHNLHTVINQTPGISHYSVESR